MFIILSYQSSNPELFCYTFALKTVLHQTKDHVTSNPNLLYNALPAGDTSGKPDQVTNWPGSQIYHIDRWPLTDSRGSVEKVKF